MAEGNGTDVEVDTEAAHHVRAGSGRHRGEVSTPPMTGGDQESKPRGRHRGARADEA
ncbi:MULTISPECIES: hypothetical protein [unclassified Streptomyces]|uniref:hypothetical protein n=1 Tax=unclassified Streptomyces TaxID=2593676 RepID=UPI00278C02E1|nr:MULTISPECIES: hypothetical protein [unclassified Streptomyces]